MLEILCEGTKNGPMIKVIGVGGGGNNALDRMMEANLSGVHYIAVNTDAQVLSMCHAETKIQIGKKLTKGYGAGADPIVGETAATENEEEIRQAIEGADMCIVTCGMGGGTGTGAAPVIAKLCKDAGILTVAVVTTPFSFENTPRIVAAKNGVEKLQEVVDTLLVIPNDKLIGLSDKALLLEDAFLVADSVLRYTIEGITNIVSNRGTVNLDFNDLRTTLLNKGTGHLGIGTVDVGEPLIEAVKQAINSPMLETTIEGAENLLINTSGKVNVMALNDAISYVKEIAGSKVNIIWGTVTQKDYDEDKVVVTLIATGMAREKKMPEAKRAEQKRPELPPFMRMTSGEWVEPAEYITRRPDKEKEIEIPPFLKNHRRER
ncbi:MAG: cell division protein FtsZ [Lachnospiraceae bacterium]|nr:cell division protein FtsZ [Lachnospiraceae bacterium]MBQ8548190.1 cell division protein FtsZ [Lachnospiraceae bacterium]